MQALSQGYPPCDRSQRNSHNKGSRGERPRTGFRKRIPPDVFRSERWQAFTLGPLPGRFIRLYDTHSSCLVRAGLLYLRRHQERIG
jgi:hypothetical protein